MYQIFIIIIVLEQQKLENMISIAEDMNRYHIHLFGMSLQKLISGIDRNNEKNAYNGLNFIKKRYSELPRIDIFNKTYLTPIYVIDTQIPILEKKFKNIL